MEEWKQNTNFSGRFKTDTSQVCEREEKWLYLQTLTQCKTQTEIWDSKVSLLALLSFPTWEIHLQDTPHSPLVPIHTDDVSSLLFLHSYFTDTKGRGSFAGAKDATPAKIPVGINMTSYATSLLSNLHCRILWCYIENMFQTCLLRFN